MNKYDYKEELRVARNNNNYWFVICLVLSLILIITMVLHSDNFDIDDIGEVMCDKKSADLDRVEHTINGYKINSLDVYCIEREEVFRI